MNILYFYESYWRNNKKENDRDSLVYVLFTSISIAGKSSVLLPI